jgi:hypothetical protein
MGCEDWMKGVKKRSPAGNPCENCGHGSHYHTMEKIAGQPYGCTDEDAIGEMCLCKEFVRAPAGIFERISDFARGVVLRWLGLAEAEGHIPVLAANLRDLQDYHRELKRRVVDIDNFLIDTVHIGVDVTAGKSEKSRIIIYSRLKGGQIREIPADFHDIFEMERFVKELQHRFRTTNVTWDMPPQMRRSF